MILNALMIGKIVCDWKTRALSLALIMGFVVCSSILAFIHNELTSVGFALNAIVGLMSIYCVFLPSKTKGAFPMSFCLLTVVSLGALCIGGSDMRWLERVLANYESGTNISDLRLLFLHTSMCVIGAKTLQTALGRF